MKQIKNISRGHRLEYDPIAQFGSILKNQTPIFWLEIMRYGLSPDVLGPLS